MLIVARTLSMLSVLLTVLAVDVWRVHLLTGSLGFEAAGFVAGLSFLPAALFAFLALVIVVRRARSGARTGFALVAVPSAVCLLILAVIFAEMTWHVS